jgi:hypothetical protein
MFTSYTGIYGSAPINRNVIRSTTVWLKEYYQKSKLGKSGTSYNWNGHDSRHMKADIWVSTVCEANLYSRVPLYWGIPVLSNTLLL